MVGWDRVRGCRLQVPASNLEQAASSGVEAFSYASLGLADYTIKAVLALREGKP